MDNQVAIWHWNEATHEWEKGQLGIETVRLLGAGLVRAGSCRCYFIHTNPSAINSSWSITDAVAALAPIKLDSFQATRDSEHCVFNPPMQLTTGLFLEAVANQTSVVFGVLSD